MAHYDVLTAAWNSSIQPPTGVSGTALTSNMTTTQKITAVNGWTITGSAVPMVVPTYKIYNLIVGSEFAALTAANQQLIRDILGMGTVDGSAGTQVRSRIVSIFTSSTTTFANLSALAATFDTPTVTWTSANGYGSGIGNADCISAGLT